MIIVIDDNRDLVDITCQILKLSGYDSIGINSGEEGLKKAKELHPKVILCDIGMDGMNGYDLAKQIKNDNNLKDTYLIAISGYNSDSDIKLSQEAGFDMHLGKPIEFETLIKILKGLDKI